VVYELHVGTFTPEGTFDAAVPRLAELADLGVTAVELMPVAQFPGRRNWGYDGVFPFAPQDSYGGPDGLKRLVDACHAAGLAALLDVVLNHFGPEGCYLREFGPYLTDRYQTPWGEAVNYDGPGSDPVRRFALDCARMWLDEYHFDGLRLDAVHAIYDLGARHVLADVAAAGREIAARDGRHVHVIAESDLNDPRLLREPERGGYGLDAQWADDFHHAAHALLTGERQGYYADFGEPEQLRRAFETPFVYAGDYSPSRERSHGAPPDGLAPDRFVVCVQNHDQVGNRAAGDRFGTLLPPERRRLAASLLLLSPHLPLLFMGEEYGEGRPFPFFCSFADPELVEAVRRAGRASSSRSLGRGDVPDPQAEETFLSAVLSWRWDDPTRAGLRRLYRDLLAARRDWPAVRDPGPRAARWTDDRRRVLEFRRGADLVAFFNLGPGAEPLAVPDGLAALFRSESPRYRGPGGADGLAPFECAAFGPPGWRGFAP
jgi:maltooligosyltrehalose trehalohydrolase